MSRLDRKFFEYHRANPNVYRLLKRFALQAKQTGHQKYSIDAIMHRVRWHLNIETKDPDGFKINNNYSSRYARLIMKNEPSLKDFFFIRKMRG